MIYKKVNTACRSLWPSLTSPLATDAASSLCGEEKPRNSMHWTFYLYCTKRFSSKIRRFVEQNRLFTGIYYKISMHQQGKMYTIISLPMNCLKQKNVAKAKHWWTELEHFFHKMKIKYCDRIKSQTLFKNFDFVPSEKVNFSVIGWTGIFSVWGAGLPWLSYHSFTTTAAHTNSCRSCSLPSGGTAAGAARCSPAEQLQELLLSTRRKTGCSTLTPQLAMVAKVHKPRTAPGDLE